MLIRLPPMPKGTERAVGHIFPLRCSDPDGPMARPPSPKVLIVEDELFVALDMEQMVEDLGCDSIGIARNAAEAVELALENSPEIILMDVNLGPGETGVDAAREILAKIPCRIVFVTAYRDAANMRRIREVSPGSPVLSKPIEIAQLRSLLKQE